MSYEKCVYCSYIWSFSIIGAGQGFDFLKSSQYICKISKLKHNKFWNFWNVFLAVTFSFYLLSHLFTSLWHETSHAKKHTKSAVQCVKRRMSLWLLVCNQETFIMVFCFVFISQMCHNKKNFLWRTCLV